MNYLTVEEFSKKIKLCPTTIRRAIKQGKIFSTRLGALTKGRHRIAESELERLYLQGMCEKNKN